MPHKPRTGPDRERYPLILGTPAAGETASLDALAALTQQGLIVKSATGWAARSLVAPAAGLTIANSDGVAGNPTFALANDLLALESLSGTGYARRTGPDQWVLRTSIPITEVGPLPTTLAGWGITNGAQGDALMAVATTGLMVRAGSANYVTRSVAVPSDLLAVTNPAGVAGDITLTLPVRAANVVFAGPSTGSDASPAFRALVQDDIPTLTATSKLSMSTARLLGRTTAGTGSAEEIVVGTGLSLAAGELTATGGSAGFWEPVTNGDTANPEIVFADGDVVVAFVP